MLPASPEALAILSCLRASAGFVARLASVRKGFCPVLWSPILSLAVAALAALLGAALGAFLTHHYNRNRDHLEVKRDVLRRVMGYRWQLSTGQNSSNGALFTALNEIAVVFAGETEVEEALRAFHQAVQGGSGPMTLVALPWPWPNQREFHTKAGPRNLLRRHLPHLRRAADLGFLFWFIRILQSSMLLLNAEQAPLSSHRPPMYPNGGTTSAVFLTACV